ncbi:TIGR01777 family oxidoreductase [Polycyclovorans algicola]|uniref:TIGR01777 family oxidoreductase n=1 Tax=Polycyclovorans algicola TaxID=616992 RepID=UPI0004A6FAB1|nr:TIGR01777 family oxidoreductase [Polycyclovorans algicola]
MNVLVTGGTGFIGTALLPALQAAGHTVTVLTRNTRQVRLPSGVKPIERLDTLATAPDALINLAGENLGGRRWSVRSKQLFVDSRIGTTTRLLDAIKRWPTPPKVLVSGSAIGRYGPRGDEVLTETSAPGDGFAAELCAKWEAVANAAETLGVRVACVRIGIVLGLPGGALGQMLPPFKLGLGGPLGSGQQWMSWVHRDDLVALMLRLVEDDNLRGAFNGTAPEPARNTDFTRALGRALKRPAILPMPGFVLRTLVGEMADELLLQGQQVRPERALAAGFTFRYPTLDTALAEVLK